MELGRHHEVVITRILRQGRAVLARVESWEVSHHMMMYGRWTSPPRVVLAVAPYRRILTSELREDREESPPSPGPDHSDPPGWSNRGRSVCQSYSANGSALT